MKKLSILLFLGISVLYFGQTIEEETSQKACKCIELKLKETNEISKEEVKECVGKSFDEVLKSKSEKEAKKYMKNMNVFMEKVKIIYKSVSDKCLPKENSDNN